MAPDVAAAAAQLDYLERLSRTGGEGRSRYARLYLAEALLARGSAAVSATKYHARNVAIAIAT